MKRKWYFALGVVLVGAVVIGLVGWGYAGPASAKPGNTCNPQDYPGGIAKHPGGHCVPATTTTAARTTSTTTAKPTTTTAGPTTSTTSATTSTTAPPGPAGGSGFSDVQRSYAYYTQISDLATRQVISGFADGTFKPDLPVTRQLFAKMIVRALGLPVTGSETCPFADVVSGQDADPFFPDKYVAVCAAQGITVGKTATTFAPYDDITREQLITMVVRAANLSDPPVDFTPPFMSGQFFPEEHYLNARMAAYAGLFTGLPTTGSGYYMGFATRGEVAVLLYNLLNR